MPSDYVDAVNVAARVSTPVEGTVAQFTIGATPVLYTVPAAWKGGWVEVHSAAEACQIAWGKDANVAVVANQASGGTPPAITFHDSTGKRYAADTDVHHYVESDITNFSIVAEAAGTEIFIRKSNP
jgi:hypothetical protein